MEWFYEQNGQSFGPVSEDELRTLIRNGTVTAECLIWCSEFGEEWKRISDVAEFADDLRSASGPNADLHPDTPNRELMSLARQRLSGVWGTCVLGFVVYFGIVFGMSFFSFLGNIAWMFLIGPLLYGITRLHLNAARGVKPKVEDMFSGFSAFWKMCWACWWMQLFVFLWMLLLVIPGIMAQYSYSQLFYILADHPELSPRDALKKSKQMMHGYRWKKFCLDCRFIGWSLLCLLTCGIGYLWLMPYMQVSYACFYESVKRRA